MGIVTGRWGLPSPWLAITPVLDPAPEKLPVAVGRSTRSLSRPLPLVRPCTPHDTIVPSAGALNNTPGVGWPNWERVVLHAAGPSSQPVKLPSFPSVGGPMSTVVAAAGAVSATVAAAIAQAA